MNEHAIAKRWRNREQRWVSPGNLFQPARFAVDVVESDTTAKTFVEREHYSGSFPAAKLSVGMFGPRAELLGVAVFSVPMTNAVITKHLGALSGCDLGRFVCRPEVGYNGETWFLARAFRALMAQKSITGVVSFADPLERVAGGIVVKPAHWGTIYQASNALYVGRSCARLQLIAPDGSVVPPRGLSKLRNEDRGWEYVERQLVSRGAPARAFGEEPRAYVARLRFAPGFSMRKHPGNLVYAFGLDSSARMSLRAMHGAGQSYPQKVAA